MAWAAALGGGVASGIGSIVGGILQSRAQNRATAEARRQYNETQKTNARNAEIGRADIAAGSQRADVAYRDFLNQTQNTFAQQNDYLKNLYGDTASRGQTAEQRLADIILNGDMSSFYNSPDFAFRQKQGELALNRQAALGGTVGAGSNLKDFSRFNQDLAGQAYQQYLANVGGIAEAGSQARNSLASLLNANVTNTANAQIGTGQSLGNLFYNTGAARAATQQNSVNPYLQSQSIQMAMQGPINQGNIWGNLAQNVGNTIGNAFNQYNQNRQFDQLLKMYQPQQPQAPQPSQTYNPLTTGRIPGSPAL